VKITCLLFAHCTLVSSCCCFVVFLLLSLLFSVLCFYIIVCPFSIIAIALSVLLHFTASDYPFSILKHFLHFCTFTVTREYKYKSTFRFKIHKIYGRLHALVAVRKYLFFQMAMDIFPCMCILFFHLLPGTTFNRLDYE
jgi:hypothetical protein